LPDASQLSGAKYTHVWHFDSKVAVERFIREDREMARSGLSGKASFIHVALYLDNWMHQHLEIQRDPLTGGYWHVDIDDGHRKRPFVWTRRNTGVLVKKPIEDIAPGAKLLAVTQHASYRELMKLWTMTLGKRLASDDGIKQVSDKFYEE
jgi:hypothetical protein